MVLIMKIFDELIKIDNEYNNGITGVNDEFFSLYINNYFNKYQKNIIILTNSLFEANKIYNSLINYQTNTLLFPMDDFLTSKAIAISPELRVNRLETINKILDGDKHIVITHLMGLLRFLPKKEYYLNKTIKLHINDVYDIKVLEEQLYDIGYNRDILVSKTGDIAVRGFIIDIYSVGENKPIRVEFFGDEIESIRYFDSDTQKSVESIDEITIYPAKDDFYVDNNFDSIINYIDDCTLFIKDYNDLKNSYLNLENDMFEYRSSKDQDNDQDYMFKFNIIDDYKYKNYYFSKENITSDKSIKLVDYHVKEIPSFHENIDLIEKYLRDHLNKKVFICLNNNQIRSFTKNIDVPYVISDLNNYIENNINIVNFEMNTGFNYQDYFFITSNELFNVIVHKKYKTNFKYSTKIKDINKLEIGDYIVHSINGIGVYNGIKSLNINNAIKDYVEISYKGNDKLYIPVEKIDLISKYSGKEGMVPKINSLGSSEWQKTKLRIRNKVHNIAGELIRLYAERQAQEGFKFSKDDELQQLFEQEFEFTPTNDQITAIEQIKDEMETTHPMDRLLCGDVGFGKTEVAFRAIFKAIGDGKQVMYLCPTTVLSMQQYNNAINRFHNFPVEIRRLDRFISTREVNETIKDFNDGKVDFLIGTHKILNDNIKPKDLGLLVIDEEQRFGVSHKEKIKKYKANVDVLTLTATPIPRTLQMSLVGIRSLSLILTPPINRYPIQTYVVEENKQLIKEAIYKELSRNGQIFILYNHIETILNKMAEIQNLVPEARIIVAHGKMNKDEIEDKMISFINNEADIMLCTTIIETGIDIPNVNTLIILDADHFGLSQLYQIRGRVGRSNKIAYAYMMYNKGKILGDSAIKRLNAIKEFTELGSGFKIANRDLTIRGAGDILGSEQAGFIDSVGVDLYLKILNDEIKKIKGEEEPVEETNNMKNLLNITTHIDDTYVDDNDLKIEIHRLINSIDSEEKIKVVQEELEDRFGKINDDIKVYMYEEYFEKLADLLEIVTVKEIKNRIELVFSEERSNKINGEKLFIDAYTLTRNFKLSYTHKRLIITLIKDNLPKHYIYYLIDLLKTLI